MSQVSSRAHYDIVIIGAGHNGLVAAAYLAKAGMKVLVLEMRAVLGGAAATEEPIPGYKINTGSNDAGLFNTKILEDLGVNSSEVSFIEPRAIVHVPEPNSPGLTLWRDPQRSIAEIERYSIKDAVQYPGFLRQISRFSAILQDVFTRVPPVLPRYKLNDVLSWIPVAFKTRLLGKTEMREFMRILPMPMSDYLDEWFETPPLKSAVGYTGVKGFFQGPKASGSTFHLLYHAMHASEAGFRASRFVRGGIGGLSTALAHAAQEHGAEICTSSPAVRIYLDAYQRVEGVSLANGERIPCRYVLSSANPRDTFLDLVGADNLPLFFVREVLNIRYRGSTTRVHFTLSELPEFGRARDTSEHLTGYTLICPDLTYLERAFDSAKYGNISTTPALEIVIPTLTDPSLSLTGMHQMSIDFRFTPYTLRENHWDELREYVGDLVSRTIENYAPGFKKLVTNRWVVTPLDYERDFGLPEGSIFHGQMSLDQLFFMRPVAGSDGGLTPLPGLILCGSGIHPGGGVTGIPGYLAAHQVLKQARP